MHYLRLRMNRIPDTPDRIGRGIAAGVLISFTPLFGGHLLFAAGLAWAMRGNVLAALLGTLIGNPLTFPFIAVAAMEVGRHLSPHARTVTSGEALLDSFTGVWSGLWHNLIALFTGAPVRWHGFAAFVDGVFIPYLVGGLVLGCLCALPCYGLTRSAVAGYQAGRRALLRARLEAARGKLDDAETARPLPSGPTPPQASAPPQDPVIPAPLSIAPAGVHDLPLSADRTADTTAAPSDKGSP